MGYLVFLTSTKHKFNLKFEDLKMRSVITKGIEILRGICLGLRRLMKIS